MRINNTIYSSDKTETNKLIKMAEETHYPEDDLVINELIKTLSKQSREFAKIYKTFMDNVIKDMKEWSIDENYYEEQISKAIENVSWDATELQKAENLMKWLKYLWLWNRETAKMFLSDTPTEDNIKTIAQPFSKYADSFIRTYLKYSYETMKNGNRIPNYIQVLRKTFCSIAKRYATSQTKKINLNDEIFKESFWEINAELEKKGITLPATDNIVQEFIKICREKYPLAKNSLDKIFENKKFKNEYIEKVINSLDDFLNDYFTEIVKKTEEFIALWFKWQKHWYIVNNVLLNYNTFIKEAFWEDNIIWKYFIEILNAFEKDHNRKLKIQEKKKEQNAPTIDVKEIPIIDEKVKKGWRYTLDEEKNSLIKEAVSYINCDEKTKTSIEKFITKLIIKDFPLKFTDLKRIFKLNIIPTKTENILTEQLWIEYEKEIEEDKTEKTIERKKENRTNNEQGTTKQEIIIEDPIIYFIERIESLNYTITNKNLLTKQISEFCKNSVYKTVLTNLLKNPNFWEILFHRWWHKKARVLPIGRTGWRLLLIKDWKNITVDSFCNHNDYWDRLVDIKN